MELQSGRRVTFTVYVKNLDGSIAPPDSLTW